MNAAITAIIEKFNAEVEAKLQETLTAILGHPPEPEELRGRCRKEVNQGSTWQRYYLDDRMVMLVYPPTIALKDGAYELVWTILPYPLEDDEGYIGRAVRLPLSPDAPEVA